MKINAGMRCHDICPKMELEELFGQVKAAGVTQIQLAMSKSISNYDFTPGHYSAPHPFSAGGKRNPRSGAGLLH